MLGTGTSLFSNKSDSVSNKIGNQNTIDSQIHIQKSNQNNIDKNQINKSKVK